MMIHHIHHSGFSLMDEFDNVMHVHGEDWRQYKEEVLRRRTFRSSIRSSNTETGSDIRVARVIKKKADGKSSFHKTTLEVESPSTLRCRKRKQQDEEDAFWQGSKATRLIPANEILESQLLPEASGEVKSVNNQEAQAFHNRKSDPPSIKTGWIKVIRCRHPRMPLASDCNIKQTQSILPEQSILYSMKPAVKDTKFLSLLVRQGFQIGYGRNAMKLPTVRIYNDNAANTKSKEDSTNVLLQFKDKEAYRMAYSQLDKDLMIQDCEDESYVLTREATATSPFIFLIAEFECKGTSHGRISDEVACRIARQFAVACGAHKIGQKVNKITGLWRKQHREVRPDGRQVCFDLNRWSISIFLPMEDLKVHGSQYTDLSTKIQFQFKFKKQ